MLGDSERWAELCDPPDLDVQPVWSLALSIFIALFLD